VTDSDSARFAAGACEDPREEICLLILYVPAQRISAQIGYLHHACKRAVDKQRSFDDALDFCEQRTLFMKSPHQACVPFGHRLVVVMNDQAVTWRSVRTLDTCEVLLKSRNYLFKSMLAYRPERQPVIKVALVDAFRKEPRAAPSRNAIGHFTHKLFAVIAREMHVRLGVVIILTDPLVQLVSCRLFEVSQLPRPRVFGDRPALIPGEILKIWNEGLFSVRPQYPRGVQFLANQAPAAEYRRDVLIGGPPMPDWYRNAREDEVVRVPRNVGCAGLIDVT